MTCYICTYTKIWDACPEEVMDDSMYSFARFTCQLNQIEDNVAPTDSRGRKDIRYFEDGDWAMAEAAKVRWPITIRQPEQKVNTVANKKKEDINNINDDTK